MRLDLPTVGKPHSPPVTFSRRSFIYKFKVNDMTCSHCASTVDKAVRSVDPGAQVTIDLTAHHVEIRSEKPALVFATAITDAGYSGELQA